jgi:hypothetical protein
MPEIQCQCGAVAVEVTGEPIAQFFCHCDDCQAVHSAAYIPVSMYPAEAVNVTRGTPKVWKRKRTPRTTCPECGTRIFADVLEVRARTVIASLLPAGTFKPTFHIQCGFAVRPVKDDLPHFKSLPAQFRGSGEKVDW